MFFNRQEVVPAFTISDYIDRVKASEANSLIIVIKGVMTPSAIRASEALGEVIQVEIFLEEELVFDVTQHDDVPQHRVIPEKDKDLLLKEYNIKTFQLPVLKATDPVARFYGLVTGQVVKIERKSETSGIYYTYRVVI